METEASFLLLCFTDAFFLTGRKAMIHTYDSERGRRSVSMCLIAVE